MKKLTKPNCPSSRRGIAIDAEFDSLILAYELDDEDGNGGERKWLLKECNKDIFDDSCYVCETLWWNCDGVPERYTEKEIGKLSQ